MEPSCSKATTSLAAAVAGAGAGSQAGRLAWVLPAGLGWAAGALARAAVAQTARHTTSSQVDSFANMEKGLRFAIREGGRTVGAGVVSEIVE